VNRWYGLALAFVLGVSSTVTLGAQAPKPQATPLYEIQESLDGTTLVLGGKPYGPVGHLFGSPVFSANFASWLFAVQPEDQTLVLNFNGKEIPLAKKVQYQGDWVLSDDGQHFAGRIGLPGDQGDETNLLMVDGKVLGPYQQLDIRPVGTGWYAVGQKKDRNAGRTLIVGDKTFGPYDDVRDNAQDPETGALAVVGYKRDKAFLVWQGKETGPFQRVWFLGGPQGSLAGIVIDNPGSSQVIVGGKVLGPYDQIGQVLVAPDRSVLFQANRKGQNLFVRDGKEVPVDWVDITRNNGKTFSMASAKGRSFFNDGTRDYGPYQNIRQRFVPETGLWAVQTEVRRGDSTANVIVTPVGEFPGDTLRSDGKTYSWISLDETGKASVFRLAIGP
jgi:hypothetical protein